MAEGLSRLASPDVEDRCQCVLGWVSGSIPSHLLQHFAGFVCLAVENKALAVHGQEGEGQRGAGWLTALTVLQCGTSPTRQPTLNVASRKDVGLWIGQGRWAVVSQREATYVLALPTCSSADQQFAPPT